MTCVIVDAETPAGIASAATAAPSISNFLTVHSLSAVEDPCACRLSHCARLVNDARDGASARPMQQKTATAPRTKSPSEFREAGSCSAPVLLLICGGAGLSTSLRPAGVV